MARWCSITFLGTPGMSHGCQANTSTFARRKVTSALSYLGSRVALMVKVPPVPSSLAGTFLVASGAAIVFLHLPVELDGASSTAAQRSEEARLPEWASEHLPGLAFLPAGLDGTSSTAAQHSEEARLPEWAPEHSPDLVFLPPEAPAASGPRAVAAVASRYIWSAQIRASFLSPGTEITLIGPGILSMLYA